MQTCSRSVILYYVDADGIEGGCTAWLIRFCDIILRSQKCTPYVIFAKQFNIAARAIRCVNCEVSL